MNHKKRVLIIFFKLLLLVIIGIGWAKPAKAQIAPALGITPTPEPTASPTSQPTASPTPQPPAPPTPQPPAPPTPEGSVTPTPEPPPYLPETGDVWSLDLSIPFVGGALLALGIWLSRRAVKVDKGCE